MGKNGKYNANEIIVVIDKNGKAVTYQLTNAQWTIDKQGDGVYMTGKIEGKKLS